MKSWMKEVTRSNTAKQPVGMGVAHERHQRSLRDDGEANPGALPSTLASEFYWCGSSSVQYHLNSDSGHCAKPLKQLAEGAQGLGLCEVHLLGTQPCNRGCTFSA